MAAEKLQLAGFRCWRQRRQSRKSAAPAFSRQVPLRQVSLRQVSLRLIWGPCGKQFPPSPVFWQGAFMAALSAQGLPFSGMQAAVRQYASQMSNPVSLLWDLTLPLISGGLCIH